MPKNEIVMSFGFEPRRSDEDKTRIVVNPTPPPDPMAWRDKLPIIVCFTGFKAADKKRLSDLATKNHMQVNKTVSHGIRYLVCGYNAGPAKIDNAKYEGGEAITEQQFLDLLETGEMPS